MRLMFGDPEELYTRGKPGDGELVATLLAGQSVREKWGTRQSIAAGDSGHGCRSDTLVRDGC